MIQSRILHPILIIATILFMGLVISSCGKESKPTEEEYLIRVDSIHVEDTIRKGSKILIEFYGVIGTNGCSRFSRFITGNDNAGYQIEVVGIRAVGPNLICPEFLPMLNGTVLELPADSSGMQLLKIINPGVNQIIRKEVFVKP